MVLLFDEFFIPQTDCRSHHAGLRGHKVHEGDLGRMKSLNSKADGVDLIADGHALRWTKQLALRGRARFYDANGVCGKQRLVVGSDVKKFMANAARLFPGATIRTVGDHSDNGHVESRMLAALNKSKAPTSTTRASSGSLSARGVKFAECANARLPERHRELRVALRVQKGRGGSRFERIGR